MIFFEIEESRILKGKNNADMKRFCVKMVDGIDWIRNILPEELAVLI
jgi:hypothetical protein